MPCLHEPTVGPTDRADRRPIVSPVLIREPDGPVFLPAESHQEHYNLFALIYSPLNKVSRAKNNNNSIVVNHTFQTQVENQLSQTSCTELVVHGSSQPTGRVGSHFFSISFFAQSAYDGYKLKKLKSLNKSDKNGPHRT